MIQREYDTADLNAERGTGKETCQQQATDPFSHEPDRADEVIQVVEQLDQPFHGINGRSTPAGRGFLHPSDRHQFR